VRYEVKLSDGRALPKGYFAFEQQENSIDITNRQLIFRASAGTSIKEFDVVVRGIVDSDQEGQAKI